MFGPRITTVFASRWKALWWAAAMLLTAYCSIPAPRDTVADKQAQAEQEEMEQALSGLIGQKQEPAEPAHHENPWALDKKPQD